MYTIGAWDSKVDISVRDISRSLYVEEFMPIEETPEYNYQMTNLKRVKMLSMDGKLIHHRWLEGHITIDSENTPLVKGKQYTSTI